MEQMLQATCLQRCDHFGRGMVQVEVTAASDGCAVRCNEHGLGGVGQVPYVGGVDDEDWVLA